MNKRVVFLNTGHYSLDDRVFYHQAKSLANNSFEVLIISTKEFLVDCIENINIKSYNDAHFSNVEKVERIVTALNDFLPDIVICDTPTAVIASSIFKRKYKTKIIYDITEWYPSKKNFRLEHGFKRMIKFITLVFFNMLAGLKSNSFIFGEFYKSIPFRLLFFWKPFIFLPYYPDLNYIKNYPLKKIETEINILYSGIINSDKGIEAVINVVEILSKKRPKVQVNLQIIGYFPNYIDQMNFDHITASFGSNVRIIIQEKLAFNDFCNAIGNSDIFLDLRVKDFENTLCLPIKLFYYFACGRPVIYSNLLSIKNKIKHFNYGYLCDPKDANTIASHIINYIDNPIIYLQHANNALDISRTKFNWKVIENDFLLFIESHTA